MPPPQAVNRSSVNPRDNANIVSILTFGWMQSLFESGKRKKMDIGDLFPQLTNTHAKCLTTSLNSEWHKEVHNSIRSRSVNVPRLWIVLARMIPVRSYLIMFCLCVCTSIASVAQPLTLGLFLRMLADPSRSVQSSVFYTLALSGVSAVKFLTMHHSECMAELWSMKLCAATTGLIYKKVLTLSRSSLTRIGGGHIINLVSNDAQRLRKIVKHCIIISYAPLNIAGYITVMWLMVGWQVLVGIAFFFALLPFNFVMAAHSSNLRQRAARVADGRLGLIGEIINGIRAVKMYAWEWNYEKAVSDIRRREVKILCNIGIYFAVNMAFVFSSASIAALISIVTLLFTGQGLSSFSIFTMLSYYGSLRYSVTVGIGDVLRELGESRISIQRIQAFLMEDPLFPDNFGDIEEKNVAKNRLLTEDSSKLAVSFKGRKDRCDGASSTGNRQTRDCTLAEINTDKLQSNYLKTESTVTTGVDMVAMCCSWDKERNDVTVLKDVTLSIHQNALVTIIGPVGCGKSSLLMAMLGELPLTDGKLQRNGAIAYAAQEPWVFSDTLRNNILFGRPFDHHRYETVLEVCDLTKDIAGFPNGDLTLIGQRGVTLSGGQRARVCLARAVYPEADIYLLDDPLSAVDATVAKNIFEKCIINLLSGKLRILVTHQAQFLKSADHIVVLNQGIVTNQGSYPQLRESGALTSALELEIEAKGQEIVKGVSVREGGEEISPDRDDEGTAIDITQSEEHRASGSVTYKIYWNYFRAGLPTVLVIGLVLTYVLGQVAIMSPYIWLSRMVNISHDQQRSSVTLYVYGGLVLSSFVLAFLRCCYIYYNVIRASANLHGKMTSSVIKSPVLFFDTTPPGRVYNRFSKDIGTMDEVLPISLIMAVDLLVFSLSSILLAIATNYWMVIAIGPLLSVFVYIAWYYLQTSRQIKRIEAVRCSSVYSHVSETITGLEVIRSSGMQGNFIEQFHSFVDDHTQAYFLVFSCARWLGIRLDSVSLLFITATAIAALLVLENAAVAGLTLVFAVEVLELSQYGIRMSADVENLMTSVERVMTYTKLHSEAGYSIGARPPASWPEKGTVEVKNLSLAYYEGGKEVLKGVSFSVQDKEKIGVVGRTGAGKSSVVASLFRMPEPRGTIVIDGVDIMSLNIQCSRRAISVITQDPVLFSGSLRRNLDPFNNFHEPQIWMALENVQLNKMVKNLPGELVYTVKESGANFSVGERQLLCLARALLQGNKIIVMDEATANVDFETDRLIQEVIRSKFKDCTILTIAHRLKTVIDYDKILVLDQGEVVEFDSPRVLLAKRDGVFSQLVKSHNFAVAERMINERMNESVHE